MVHTMESPWAHYQSHLIQNIENLSALTQDKLVENSANMGRLFRQGLDKLKEKHPVIREVRGKGLMIGVELKFEVRDILMEGIEKGLLLLYSGRNILRLLPPLVITEADVTKSLEILDELFTMWRLWCRLRDRKERRF